MATASVAEPSVPEERKAEGLPPKSYAEAAEPGSAADHGTTPADLAGKLKENHQKPHAKVAQSNGIRKISMRSGESSSKRPPSSPDSSERPASKERANTAIASLYGDGVTQKTFEDSKVSLTTTTSPRPKKAQLAMESKEKASSRRDGEKKSQDPLVSGRNAGAGWRTSRIRWAPANVPLQRRLQTFMVLWHALSIAALLSISLLLCAIPLLWPIMMPYLLYCLLSTASTSGELKQRSNWLRSLKVWSLFASYFPARLHRSAPLLPTRKYIFGYHPHGIISHGAFAAFCTEALGFSQLFPGITNTLLTLDTNFRVPFYRDYILAMGLASVSKESCENILSKGGVNGEGMGRAITIVVGGARESLDAEPGVLRLVLKRRKGFIKLALRAGADLVPVLGFGENDIFDQVNAKTHPRVHKLQLALKKALGFTVPLFHARGVFNYDVGLLPYRRPINIVVGRPIQVERRAKPTAEEVDALHARYIDELMRLWDENKDQFAKERKSELEMIE